MAEGLVENLGQRFTRLNLEQEQGIWDSIGYIDAQVDS